MQQTKTAIQAIQDIEAREQDIEAREQADFDAENEAYQQTYMSVDYREENASRMDTNYREPWTLHAHRRFDFAEPNWNDTLDETEMWHRCDQIADTLRRRADTQPAQDTLADNQHLLDASFSENIKQHIVTLTATTETIEGACKHCFGFYDTDSQPAPHTPMQLWHTLCNILPAVSVFNAFLERAWHLNPTSKHFPHAYKEIARAARQAKYELDTLSEAPLGSLTETLRALNDNAKQIQYALRHTNNPREISRLTHAHVKVLGALTVLRERTEQRAAHTLSEAKASVYHRQDN